MHFSAVQANSISVITVCNSLYMFWANYLDQHLYRERLIKTDKIKGFLHPFPFSSTCPNWASYNSDIMKQLFNGVTEL